MTITIIQTSQAPDAKPIAISKTVSTDWEALIEVPSYEVPEQSFGGGTSIVPGVGEIISPLIVSNTTANTAAISIRIYRIEANTEFFIANELPIAGNDVTPIPLNGQFILTGDRLELKSTANNVLDITISYTVGQAEQDDVI
jgi:hypothetical protein